MNLEDCIELDQRDELRGLRKNFQLPEDVIYLDGNSLGPLQRSVSTRISKTVVGEWGSDLIRSWNDNDWINLPVTVGEKIARLIGAAPGQVICADSVSINLFKLLSSALSLRPDRNLIVSTTNNFPTDLYMAQGLASLTENRCSLRLVEPEDVVDSLSDAVAVLMLTEVDFRTGKRWNLSEINALAHEKGVLVIWDLSHSVGAVPVNLDESQTDFAVGCGYKFLNGGPGAPAFLYVAKPHQEAWQPLMGWMGHANPFDFSTSYEPAAGIRRFGAGTPGIIGLSALDAAMDLWQDISMDVVHRKSISLANIVRHRIQSEKIFAELNLVGPGPGLEGGSQISLRHPHSYEIVQALIERGVIGDFRTPDIIRFGLCPLFLSHVDIYNAMSIVAEVLGTKSYEEERFQTRAFVT